MKKAMMSIVIILILAIMLPFCLRQSIAEQQLEKMSEQALLEELPPALSRQEVNDADENIVTLNGRLFSIDEINKGIKAAFNSAMYYFGLDWYEPFYQNDVEYDLYYDQKNMGYYAPATTFYFVVTNVLHDYSSERELLYHHFGIRLTEYGLHDDFCFRSYGSWKDTVLTHHESEIYLGHYAMRIDEVIPPQYEPKDAEWQESTIKVIQKYMDKTIPDYADEDYELKSGNYQIFMKNFNVGETSSLVIFKHQNGDVYWGQYCELNYTSSEHAPYINHVHRIDWDNVGKLGDWEQEDVAIMRDYVEKIELHPAVSLEYSIKPWVAEKEYF